MLAQSPNRKISFESPSKVIRAFDGQHNQGKWTNDEHKMFLEGLTKFGKNWNQIQKYVKTRSCPQTRSHAQKFFRKLEKHGYIQGMSTSATNNEVKPKANMLNEEEDKGSQDAEFKTLISKQRPRINSVMSERLNGENAHELSDLDRKVIQIL